MSAPTRKHQALAGLINVRVANFLEGKPCKVYISPSTTKKDLREKFDLFQRMGVKEYWLIEPEGRWLNRLDRGEDGRFGQPEVRDPVRLRGSIPSRVLEGFVVDPEDLFAAE
jgi:Uma2 family endonuclease